MCRCGDKTHQRRDHQCVDGWRVDVSNLIDKDLSSSNHSSGISHELSNSETVHGSHSRSDPKPHSTNDFTNSSSHHIPINNANDFTVQYPESIAESNPDHRAECVSHLHTNNSAFLFTINSPELGPNITAHDNSFSSPFRNSLATTFSISLNQSFECSEC
jgi:hypothetical protein